jgi:cytidyltransferase-like protein
MIVVLITGGFDPIHSGHIAYLNAAKELGDILVVGVNSDEWLRRKKGRSFMALDERKCIIANLAVVDNTISFNDDDDSAKNAITQVRQMYPSATIIFANGGDRTKDNIPEMNIEDDNVQFVFGVGGAHKMNSSSWILEEWKAPKTDRIWGHYRVLYEYANSKVKELVVNPGCSLSMQKHSSREEFWFVAEGVATLHTLDENLNKILTGEFNQFDQIDILKGQWHQLSNFSNEPLKVVEIQYGEQCIEEDIERI